MVLREQRQRILGKIAFEHLVDMNQGTNLLSWQHGVSVVQNVAGLDFQSAELRLREISKETGLITEERPGETFRFIHLTFCEFLAAFEAVQGHSEGWKKLVKYHQAFSANYSTRSRLVEVLPFACSLMPRHMRPQAICDLAELQDGRVLALAFLETKAYDHPIWPIFVADRQRSLLASTNLEWDSEWLREV